MVIERKWHEDHDTLVGLASWLTSESYLGDAEDVVAYLEKPWKWEREFELWQLWAKESDPDVRERILVALMDEITADEFTADEEERREREPEQLSAEEIAEIKGDEEYHRRKDEGEL